MLVSLLGVLAVLTINLIENSNTEDNFVSITPESCTCPGDELVFECTIDGDAGTYWQGTALEECLQGRILIRHSQFHGGGHMERRSCGASGTVIVRTISVANNSFTTQLTIIVNQRWNGYTVECESDIGRVIGRTQISLKAAPSVSSVSYTLHNVKQRKLTFTRTSTSESCPATSYKIFGRNCGDCPHTSNSTFVTCNNIYMTHQASICTFTAQSVVCGSILGKAAVPIAVLIHCPPPPKIINIKVLHNRNVHTFVSILSGSRSHCQIGRSPVISYTIMYFDPQTNASCGLDTIAASSCIDQICDNVFDLDTLCSNLTSLSVTVLATDRHGYGKESEPITVVLMYTESDGNANDYAHQTLENNTSKFTIIIIVGSTFGGIIFLLLLAVIVLSLTVLLCHKFHSLCFSHQNDELKFEDHTTTAGVNSDVDIQIDAHEDEATTNNEKHLMGTIHYNDTDMITVNEEPVIVKENPAYGQIGSSNINFN